METPRQRLPHRTTLQWVVGVLSVVVALPVLTGVVDALRHDEVGERLQGLVSPLVLAVLLLPAGLASIPASTDLRVWVLVIVSSLASAFGNYLLVVVNRTTPATVSAPLIYFQLIAATVIGFFVFGDWPEPLTLLGLAVIFASGVGGLALVPKR